MLHDLDRDVVFHRKPDQFFPPRGVSIVRIVAICQDDQLIGLALLERLATVTVSADGKATHGLNGDILVWNPVTRRRHELTSMGVRVTKETLVTQLAMTGQLDFLELPYHQAIMNDQIPLSIGGGIGQSRTYMMLLKKAHLGEVSVTVWPKILKDMCAKKNIHVLE